MSTEIKKTDSAQNHNIQKILRYKEFLRRKNRLKLVDQMRRIEKSTYLTGYML